MPEKTESACVALVVSMGCSTLSQLELLLTCVPPSPGKVLYQRDLCGPDTSVWSWLPWARAQLAHDARTATVLKSILVASGNFLCIQTRERKEKKMSERFSNSSIAWVSGFVYVPQKELPSSLTSRKVPAGVFSDNGSSPPIISLVFRRSYEYLLPKGTACPGIHANKPDRGGASLSNRAPQFGDMYKLPNHDGTDRRKRPLQIA